MTEATIDHWKNLYLAEQTLRKLFENYFFMNAGPEDHRELKEKLKAIMRNNEVKIGILKS